MTLPRVICCDLDGVIWRGDEPIPGGDVAVAQLRAAGFRVAFMTNNSSGRVADYVDKLAGMGIPADPDDVITSAQAAAALLADTASPGARVHMLAGPGVAEALTAEGFELVADAPAEAVVVGFSRDFDFDRLARAADIVRAGARLVATNTDPTYPAAHGLLPGAGSLVAAVSTASGATPEVAGKPAPPTVALVRARLGNEGIVIGDRPSTDGALAAALGWPFGLVLSGIAGTQNEEAIPDPRPAFVAADIASIVPQLITARD
ncbi:MAG: HAD-superfamily hydrolase, subfamily [Actinomycetia bacterium]|nr:HAD-superfamily hydrolase, subfamily [Actinomycetes bacterium]